MTRPSALKKKKRTRRRPMRKRIAMPPDEDTSSDAGADQDYTLSPSSSLRDGRTIRDIEATEAPEIGERETGQEEYAGSTAALLDKYIFSGRGIPFVVILVIIGWIFIQDNKAGKLEDWGSVLWTIEKCSFFLVLYLVFLIYQWAIKKKRT